MGKRLSVISAAVARGSGLQVPTIGLPLVAITAWWVAPTRRIGSKSAQGGSSVGIGVGVAIPFDFSSALSG
jgi:hypothetical protein